MMDLMIHNFLSCVLPLFTVIIFVFLLPAVYLFNFFNYVVKSLSPEKLAGKVVLITGASSGIGEYMAYEYAKRGACLALVARREEILKVVAATAKELGSPDVMVISADVSKVEDCKRFVETTINHFGTLDHLVNNAGICWVQDERCASNYVSVMDINFWGSVYTTQFAVPHLRKSKGKITVISSTAGWLSLPKASIYGASKAALISYFETLRVEVGTDIGITIVTPGVVESSITNDEWLSQVNLKWLPKVWTRDCAKAIVDSATRGDDNLTVPPWMNVLFVWKILCPNVLRWTGRSLFVRRSKVSVVNNKPDRLNSVSKSE